MMDSEAARIFHSSLRHVERPSRASARGLLRFLGSRIAGASAGSYEAQICFDVFVDRPQCNSATLQISKRTGSSRLEAGTKRVVSIQDWAAPDITYTH